MLGAHASVVVFKLFKKTTTFPAGLCVLRDGSYEYLPPSFFGMMDAHCHSAVVLLHCVGYILRSIFLPHTFSLIDFDVSLSLSLSLGKVTGGKLARSTRGSRVTSPATMWHLPIQYRPKSKGVRVCACVCVCVMYCMYSF